MKLHLMENIRIPITSTFLKFTKLAILFNISSSELISTFQLYVFRIFWRIPYFEQLQKFQTLPYFKNIDLSYSIPSQIIVLRRYYNMTFGRKLWIWNFPILLNLIAFQVFLFSKIFFPSNTDKSFHCVLWCLISLPTARASKRNKKHRRLCTE